MKKTTRKNLRMIAAMLCVLIVGTLAGCGSRPSRGTYVPEDASAKNAYFDSLEFEGGAVYVGAAGSTIGFDYKISGDTFEFKNNMTLTIGDTVVPTSFSYSKESSDAFILDGVRYIRVD